MEQLISTENYELLTEQKIGSMSNGDQTTSQGLRHIIYKETNAGIHQKLRNITSNLLFHPKHFRLKENQEKSPRKWAHINLHNIENGNRIKDRQPIQATKTKKMHRKHTRCEEENEILTSYSLERPNESITSISHLDSKKNKLHQQRGTICILLRKHTRRKSGEHTNSNPETHKRRSKQIPFEKRLATALPLELHPKHTRYKNSFTKETGRKAIHCKHINNRPKNKYNRLKSQTYSGGNKSPSTKQTCHNKAQLSRHCTSSCCTKRS